MVVDEVPRLDEVGAVFGDEVLGCEGLDSSHLDIVDLEGSLLFVSLRAAPS